MGPPPPLVFVVLQYFEEITLSKTACDGIFQRYILWVAALLRAWDAFYSK